MDTVEFDGRVIAFERSGEGPPLVLLHGGASDHREWRAQIEGLADAFTVIAWDAPGCGGSFDPPDGFGMEAYAAVLEGFLTLIEIAPAHVLGLSWGSTLALSLYERRPQLVRSLLLASAYAGWRGSLSPEELERRLHAALASLEHTDGADEWIPTLLTERATEAARRELLAIVADARPSGTRPMLLAMAEADLRHVLPTIEVPTLLVYGDEDVRSPRAVAEELHAAIPGSQLRFLPEVGHQANIETPARFNMAVRSFLAGLE